MKIRCEQDSIRLRLRKSEIAQLRNEAWLRTSVHFPDGSEFGWELALDENAPNPLAQLANGSVRITLPFEAAHHWMESEQVGLEMFQPLESGGSLHLLVEKDFPCKDRPEESTDDFFQELAETTPPGC